MVREAEIKKYLRENPGCTVDFLNKKHYGRYSHEGEAHISFVLFYLIAIGEVRCELAMPDRMQTRFYLLDEKLTGN